MKNKIIGIENFDSTDLPPNPRVSIYKKGITMKIYNHFGGYNLLFENDKGKTISAIFHSGSYGAPDGLWEVMPARTKKVHDEVEGYLTFEEVIKFVNKYLKIK